VVGACLGLAGKINKFPVPNPGKEDNVESERIMGPPRSFLTWLILILIPPLLVIPHITSIKAGPSIIVDLDTSTVSAPPGTTVTLWMKLGQPSKETRTATYEVSVTIDGESVLREVATVTFHGSSEFVAVFHVIFEVPEFPPGTYRGRIVFTEGNEVRGEGTFSLTIPEPERVTNTVTETETRTEFLTTTRQVTSYLTTTETVTKVSKVTKTVTVTKYATGTVTLRVAGEATTTYVTSTYSESETGAVTGTGTGTETMEISPTSTETSLYTNVSEGTTSSEYWGSISLPVGSMWRPVGGAVIITIPVVLAVAVAYYLLRKRRSKKKWGHRRY